VHPTRDENLRCDVHEIVQHLHKKGAETPLILRFPQILTTGSPNSTKRSRRHPGVRLPGRLPGVYPVKCNQMKEVVDQVVKSGYKYRYGLEAGSKPELMIALSMNLHRTRSCCATVTRTRLSSGWRCWRAKRAQGVDHVEKMTELSLILKVAKTSRWSPCWPALQAQRLAAAGGKARPGTIPSSAQHQELLERGDLERRGLLDSLQELHFHIAARSPTSAGSRRHEGGHPDVRQAGEAGVPLKYLNVGGGLGWTTTAPAPPSVPP